MSWNGRLPRSFIYLPLILTRQLDLWHCHMGTGCRGQVWYTPTSHSSHLPPLFTQFGASNWCIECSAIRIFFSQTCLMRGATCLTSRGHQENTSPASSSLYIINMWKLIRVWHGARGPNELQTRCDLQAGGRLNLELLLLHRGREVTSQKKKVEGRASQILSYLCRTGLYC